MRWWLVPILLASQSQGFDLSAYCKGWCSQRYQDGSAVGDRCACTDYYPVNLSNRIEVPKHPKEKGESSVYYGRDEMHVPTYDETPPTY